MLTTLRISPDATILVRLCQSASRLRRPEIGEACRMKLGEVRARLVGLESRRFVVGRQDALRVPPARTFTITGEGRREVER